MATQYKTPGVYIKEIDAFSKGIVGVVTAEPAFIGYTELALDPATQKPLIAPVRIASLVEYQRYFGGPSTPNFVVAPTLATHPAFTADTTGADGTVIHSGFDLTLVTTVSGPDRFCLYWQNAIVLRQWRRDVLGDVGGKLCPAGRIDRT